MTTNDARVSTTHIATLPRPPELLGLLTRHQDGETVDPEITWAKLAALVEGAEVASDRLA